MAVIASRFGRPELATTSSVEDRSATARGAAWLLLGAFLLTSMTATTKLIANDVSPFQVTFFRALFGLVLLTPLAIRAHGVSVVRTNALSLQITRGLISASGMTATVYAVTDLDLATATAIAFTTPLFIVVLAGVFLREQVSAVRWAGTVAGFSGVLFISPPGYRLGLAAGAALFGALAVGAAKLLVKELATRDTNHTILIHLSLVMMAATAVPSAIFWKPLSGRELLALTIVGGLSMSGQACAIHGYKVARASAVAPVEYSRLLWATVLGLIVFGQAPGLNTMVGAIIVVLSTLVATWADEPRRPDPEPAALARPHLR